MNLSVEGLSLTQKAGNKWVAVTTLYRGACIVFHSLSLLQTKIILFNENGLRFRGVMPECIFVLLGLWNRDRCFLKDERNGMGAHHTRLQNLQRMHNSLIFPQEKRCV